MDTFVLSLLVTEEQKLTIEALFNHNNWDFITVSPTKERNEVTDEAHNISQETGHIDSTDKETAGTSTDTRQRSVENRESVSDSDSTDTDDSSCEYCFCSPCVTVNEQSWMGKGSRPKPTNRISRKIRYKKFWSMLERRNAWRKRKYLRKKARLLGRNDESTVFVQRDIMPNCVLNLVRERYPNPPGQPYTGHYW